MMRRNMSASSRLWRALIIAGLFYSASVLVPHLPAAETAERLPEGYTGFDIAAAILFLVSGIALVVLSADVGAQLVIERRNRSGASSLVFLATSVAAIAIFFGCDRVTSPILSGQPWIWPTIWLGIAGLSFGLSVTSLAISNQRIPGAAVTPAPELQGRQVVRFCTTCGEELADGGKCPKCTSHASVSVVEEDW
ncbi:MAG: hypothetical protein D8M53_08015 [Armatimonadetes bacterium]|nr:hypothetical protein [Armatimonadota bacterium]